MKEANKRKAFICRDGEEQVFRHSCGYMAGCKAELEGHLERCPVSIESNKRREATQTFTQSQVDALLSAQLATIAKAVRENCIAKRHQVNDDGMGGTGIPSRPQSVTLCGVCSGVLQAIEEAGR